MSSNWVEGVSLFNSNFSFPCKLQGQLILCKRRCLEEPALRKRTPNLYTSKVSADYFPICVLISHSSVFHPAHILTQQIRSEHPPHVWERSKLLHTSKWGNSLHQWVPYLLGGLTLQPQALGRQVGVAVPLMLCWPAQTPEEGTASSCSTKPIRAAGSRSDGEDYLQMQWKWTIWPHTHTHPPLNCSPKDTELITHFYWKPNSEHWPDDSGIDFCVMWELLL